MPSLDQRSTQLELSLSVRDLLGLVAEIPRSEEFPFTEQGRENVAYYSLLICDNLSNVDQLLVFVGERPFETF